MLKCSISSFYSCVSLKQQKSQAHCIKTFWHCFTMTKSRRTNNLIYSLKKEFVCNTVTDGLMSASGTFLEKILVACTQWFHWSHHLLSIWDTLYWEDIDWLCWAMFSTQMAQELPLPAWYPPLLHPSSETSVSSLIYHYPIISCTTLFSSSPPPPRLEGKTSKGVGREERAVFACQQSGKSGC
jgi:hypothetical protein